MILESLIELVGTALGSSAMLGTMSGMSQRFLQTKTISRFEQAQISNMGTSIELQRERLRIEEDRALEQIKEARATQIRQIEANIHLLEHGREIDKWPLQPMAISIVRHAECLSYNSLNIIMKMSSPNREFSSSPGLASTREIILESAEKALSDAQRLFGHDVTLYEELHLPTPIRGQSLAVTLFGMLSTVPTALIEVRVTGFMQYRFSIRLWGWTIDAVPQISSPTDVLFDVSAPWHELDPKSPDPVASKELRERTVQELSLALGSLVTQLGDSFHLLRRRHHLPQLRLPQIMSDAARHHLPESSWNQVMTNYVGLNDTLAVVAPALAADITAGMALSAHKAGQSRFAKMLLEHALVHYRAGLKPPLPVDDAGLMQEIMAHQSGSELNLIQKALRDIHGLATGADGISRRLSLRDVARAGISGLQ